MANPKYKTSHSKTRRRRANINLTLPSVTLCPNCKEPKLTHHLCSACGKYRGKDILKVEDAQES